jgi:hypothetical protein
MALTRRFVAPEMGVQFPSFTPLFTLSLTMGRSQVGKARAFDSRIAGSIPAAPAIKIFNKETYLEIVPKWWNWHTRQP